MEVETSPNCYVDDDIEDHRFYLEETKVHEICLRILQNILPSTFKRLGAGQSNLDVLGVGSGEGEMDVGLLLMLQDAAPDASITAEVVEGSVPLTQDFKALVANNQDLKQIPFTWHIMCHEAYERQVKAQKHPKKFDFIHLIEVIYYLNNLADVISFYHSLLKENGRLMIILEANHSGIATLWKAYHDELCDNNSLKNYTSADVISLVRNMGLEFEEYIIPFTIDITECFDPDSHYGGRMLAALGDKDNVNGLLCVKPEIKEGILGLLKAKCSTEEDGKILFNNDFSCIIIHA